MNTTLKFGSILFTNCKTLIVFLFADGPRQMWEFFFPFFNQLFPLSSLLSCLPSCLPLHSHSLPLSSSSRLKSVSPRTTSSHWSRSRLKPPQATKADLTWSHLAWSWRSFLEPSRLELLMSPLSTLPIFLSLSFSWCLW